MLLWLHIKRFPCTNIERIKQKHDSTRLRQITNYCMVKDLDHITMHELEKKHFFKDFLEILKAPEFIEKKMISRKNVSYLLVVVSGWWTKNCIVNNNHPSPKKEINFRSSTEEQSFELKSSRDERSFIHSFIHSFMHV